MTGSTSTALVIANVSSGSAWKRRTRPVSGSVSRSTLSGIALFGAPSEALRGFLMRRHQGLPLRLRCRLDELGPDLLRNSEVRVPCGGGVHRPELGLGRGGHQTFLAALSFMGQESRCPSLTFRPVQDRT